MFGKEVLNPYRWPCWSDGSWGPRGSGQSLGKGQSHTLYTLSLQEVMDPILQRRNAFSQGIMCPISDNNRLHTRTVHLLHRHFIICIICMQIMSTYLFALQTILLDLGRQMHRRMFYKAVIPSVSPSACRFWCNNLLPSKYGTHHIPR